MQKGSDMTVSLPPTRFIYLGDIPCVYAGVLLADPEVGRVAATAAIAPIC